MPQDGFQCRAPRPGTQNEQRYDSFHVSRPEGAVVTYREPLTGKFLEMTQQVGVARLDDEADELVANLERSRVRAAAGCAPTPMALVLTVALLWTARQKHADHPLVNAVTQGRIHRVRELVKKNNVGGNLGGAALCASALAKDGVQMLKELLALGVDVHAKKDSGATALTCAGEAGRADLLEVLLDMGTRINVQNRRGYTALGQAIRSAGPSNSIAVTMESAIAAVRLLLRRGAAVDVQTRDGFSSGPNAGYAHSGQTPLMDAAVNGMVEIVELLLAHGAKADVQNGFFLNALEIACMSSGLAANSEDKTRLKLRGTQQEYRNVATLLYRAGARFEAFRGSGLDEGCEAMAVARLPFEYIAEFKRTKLPALPRHVFDAARSNDLRYLAAWLPTGDADARFADRDEDVSAGITYDRNPLAGRTLLMLASADGHLEMVRLLIEHGATINLQDRGLSALMLAVRAGGTDPDAIVALLLAKGASTDLQSLQGKTALMMAVDRGRASLMELLIRRGAALDLQDVAGRDATAWAKGDRAMLAALKVASASRTVLKCAVTIATLLAAAMAWTWRERLSEWRDRLSGREDRRERMRRRTEKKKKKREEAADASRCVSCMDRLKTHASNRCMHKCLCGECAEGLQNMGGGLACPVCREPVDEFRRVYE